MKSICKLRSSNVSILISLIYLDIEDSDNTKITCMFQISSINALNVIRHTFTSKVSQDTYDIISNDALTVKI